MSSSQVSAYGHFRESDLNFNFSIASIKSNYGEIFSFPNKLKFDDSNICTKLLIREQIIINNCPSDTLISLLKSYVRMLKYLALLKYGWKLQIFYSNYRNYITLETCLFTFIYSISEKLDPRPGTHLLGETRDPRLGTQLIGAARNPKGGTRDPGH